MITITMQLVHSFTQTFENPFPCSHQKVVEKVIFPHFSQKKIHICFVDYFIGDVPIDVTDFRIIEYIFTVEVYACGTEIEFLFSIECDMKPSTSLLLMLGP